jgi:hypothetical protein
VTRGSVGLTALLAASACSGSKSYAVVTVRATTGEFPAVAQFGVHLTNDPGRRDTLFYPRSPAGPFRVSTTETVDLSVSFSARYLGTLKVGVAPRDSDGSSLGYGETEMRIDPGEVIRMDVAVTRDALPPVMTPGDGGWPSSCEPASADSCGAGNACHVRCLAGTSIGACSQAGQSTRGAACTSNAECISGTTCFEHACGKICMKFCETDGECGQGRCTIHVPCGGTSTDYRVCSQPCDPRGDGTTGCAGGLRCFVSDDENPSCACRGADKGEGTSCEGERDCQPGLICVMESAARVCRPVCRLSDGICPSGRTCAQLAMPEYRTWGACVPS